MLAILTDEHISPSIAKQVKAKRPGIVIHSLHNWRNGAFLREDDDVILTAALEEGLTFVTYDQRTISPMITQWAAEGRNHAGIVFIDEKSIAQEDIGGKIRALVNLWDAAQTENCTNVVTYLKPR